jgi:drug/metabolite transporter (DMT)-like permease
MAELALPAAARAERRHPRLGYAMAAGAAALFAFNGIVSKVLLLSGMPAQRLTELRSTGACLGLFALLLLVAPERARISRREIPFLVFFGVCGFALVQWFFFIAIERLPVGIALLIQFTAPVFVALWARFVRREHLRRRFWVALALSLAGLSLVAQVWSGVALDTAGVVAAIGGALTLALYYLGGEHGVGERDPVSLVAWAMLFSALFWALVQPWWSFPFGELSDTPSLLGNLDEVSAPGWLLVLWLLLMGTIAPFVLMIGSLRHLPATRVGVVAMVEPVLGALFAWIWLGESLATPQLVGGALVLAGIVLAQTAR